MKDETKIRELIATWRAMANNEMYTLFSQGNTGIGLERAANELEKLMKSERAKGSMMKISEALEALERYQQPITLTVTVKDDGMIDAVITPAGDPLEEIGSHYGPGSIAGAIIEMVADMETKTDFSPFYE